MIHWNLSCNEDDGIVFAIKPDCIYVEWKKRNSFGIVCLPNANILKIEKIVKKMKNIVKNKRRDWVYEKRRV